jgi:hypothetical protein
MSRRMREAVQAVVCLSVMLVGAYAKVRQDTSSPPQDAESSQQTTQRIGFTRADINQDHFKGSCGIRAQFVSSNGTKKDIPFKDPRPSEKAGTQFRFWLPGKRQAVIGRISRKDGQPCLPDVPIDRPNIVFDNYVVDVTTGTIISAVTANFRKAQPTGSSYFYNAAIQPIYDPQDSTKAPEFILSTMPRLDDPNSELWRVAFDGTFDRKPLGQLLAQIGNHSCALSPNGKFLACEPKKEDKINFEIQVLPLNGSSVSPVYARVRWRNNPIPLPVAYWSPNSEGFVFGACNDQFVNSKNQCEHGGSLLYSQRSADGMSPPIRIAPNWLPSFFYNSCGKLGLGDHGSPKPVWSPDGNWLYYFAVDPRTSGSKTRPVLGRVSMAQPESPGEFTPIDFAPDVLGGQPSVSPDGEKVAIIGQNAPSDNRMALWVVDLCESKSKRIVSYSSLYEVDNPAF